MEEAKCHRYIKRHSGSGARFCFLGDSMKVSIQRASVDHRGEVRGLDGILCSALQMHKDGPGFECANALSIDIGRLSRELLELGWICKEFAAAGEEFGYEAEVCIDEKSIRTVQVYRIPAAPSPGPPHPRHAAGAHPGVMCRIARIAG